jgi:VIT1/CCC1 family predicted Fe2+/Mn2+ transporter
VLQVTAPESSQPERADRERRGLFSLIAEVPKLLRELLEAEIASLKAEISGKIKAAGIGAGLLVGAGFFAFIALLVLVAAAILALALVVPAWAAALIVAGILLAITGIIAGIGVNHLKRAVPPTPTETIDSVKKDVRAVRGIRKRDAT